MTNKIFWTDKAAIGFYEFFWMLVLVSATKKLIRQANGGNNKEFFFSDQTIRYTL
jgi:hypothetical protein